MTPRFIDLGNLGINEGFIVQGAEPGDRIGISVSDAGDVNGDGIDDFIVGATSVGNGAGVAYVIFGRVSGFRTTIEVGNLASSDGYLIRGDMLTDAAGRGVSAAGDINGDGIGDLIVGAPGGDDGGYNAGEAYVIFGKSGATRTDIDLSSLAAADGFIVQADAAGDRLGRAVSGAGDVNGDGIDDFILGAYQNDAGSLNAGEAYVIYGKAGSTRANIDLTNLTASDGFKITGSQPNDIAGYSVSGAGDVNGDGIDDLLVGSQNSFNYLGATYVIFGTQSPTRANIDLDTFSAFDGFIIQGDDFGDRSGASVSNAGDVNGDGVDDIVIGASFGDGGGDRAGETYVVFGKVGAARSNINLTNLSANDGFIIQGDEAFDRSGISVSGAGDVNGDGFDDLIVGAVFGDGGGLDSGQAYIIFGRSGATRGNIDLTNLSFADGILIIGDAAQDAVGRSVSAAGDVNGDGFDDIIIGAYNGDDGGYAAGEAYIIFGSQFVEPISGTPLADSLSGTVAGDILNGLENDDILSGLDGNDVINGNSGNDLLDGGAGDDVLAGGLGNDIYVVDSEFDTVVETTGAGVDAVESSAERFALSNNIENLVLTGAAFAGTGNALGNRITGTSGDNSLDGAAGADVLQGLGGNDIYYVDNANDRVVETLSLTVGDTNDAGGVDTVFASVSYSLDTASNVRFVENLSLLFATGNVNGTGNALANVIEGNGGNNILDGGAGNDVLVGYGGNDIYLVDAAGDVVTEGAGAGTDTVRASVSYTLAAHVENLQLQGSANITGIGNGEANAITGTSGNNRLEGLGGNDAIDGGLGADTMLGGAGDDSYIIDNGNDRVFETLTSNAADTNDAGGIDTVSTSITINMNGYNGIRFVERAVLTGTASIGITGNALANHINGNTGNNSIDGGEGADTMIGRRGNDIYTVDSIGDVVTEVVGQGFDTVRASISYTLGSDVEDLVLTGTANLNGTGNGLANRLTGNSGNNILDGGGGTDTLIGGAGNDTYIFDSAGDRAVETVTATVTDTNDAGGIDQIFSSFTVNLNQSNGMRFIENVTLTGTAAAAVYGNDLGNAITANSGANFLDGANGDDSIFGMGGNDTMLGRAGNDSLDGGAGRDRLTGGAGQDILTGGSEADTFVFATGDMGTSQATADRITDWSGLGGGGQGDRIDLSVIDANGANGAGTNEAFTFIGSSAFSNVAGQLRSEVIGGDTYLMADTNGDGIADLWLQLDGTVTVGVEDLAL